MTKKCSNKQVLWHSARVRSRNLNKISERTLKSELTGYVCETSDWTDFIDNYVQDSCLFAGLDLMDKLKLWVSPFMAISIFQCIKMACHLWGYSDCSARQLELATPLVTPRPPSPLIGSLRCGSLDSLQEAYSSERPQSDISDDGKPVLLNCVMTYLCFLRSTVQAVLV